MNWTMFLKILDIAQMTSPDALVGNALSLRHILYDFETISFRNLHDGLHVADTSVEMHHHDGFGGVL